MVYYHSSISVCNSVGPSPNRMANSYPEISPKSKQGISISRSKKSLCFSNCAGLPVCDASGSAIIDVVLLIAVLCAFSFLLFPSIKFATCALIEAFSIFYNVFRDEILMNPLIYASIGLGTFSAAIVAWFVVLCAARKCGNPKCRGLRKAVECDIQLETEECVRNSLQVNFQNKRGLHEIQRDQLRELEAELRKMAPTNGRAVLVFRARCGCSVGRLEVPGPKRVKKIKK